MTIKLPPALKTYQYRDLTVFSLLDTDTDRVLPQLFELCVKGGRTARSKTDARDFAGYRERLLNSGFVNGFDNADDQALLDGWLRSCVVDMGSVGRSRTGEQMLAVAPLTLAAYRAGLPTRRERHRGIDDFVYRLLLAAVGRRGSRAERRDLREMVGAAVGRGIVIGPEPRWEPRLADAAQLDIGALLELRFVEGFEMSDAKEIEGLQPNSPLPRVADDMGTLLLSHLTEYGHRLPTQALMSSFAALLALSVLTFSLRVDAAARDLLRTGELPPDMREEPSSSTLELYCDFTGVLDSESDRMSRRCVERDLDRVRLAFRDRMTFVVVQNALERMASEKERRATMTRPEQLAHAASLRTHPRVEAYALSRLEDLVFDPGPDVTELEQEFLQRIQGGDSSELDKLLDVLQHVNQNPATAAAVQWFWSVGGLQKPYGLLDGQQRSRRTWRYAPSDELLTALLLAVFLRPGGAGVRPTMPLHELLAALRDRFGLLIDRPPARQDGAEARAAAAANLEAFKRRLQLLGCFDSLSDDFSVQVVHHPLGAS
ncbi:methylation-associated defense system protein MAD7 [Pseudonocardia broussonetiae]|uniref:Uncharacterized protein n=1 Tax=Pseudonocardia broussonetiae TaxID=2736640 RepID=A0A6M6JRB6_9PSEU|nr:hypothetical protein [Pseudonocardia broussonetiae]QJY49850.1 hypothetical protein HOP40_32180 [Pseudonocardia broussonetiae]